MSPEARAAHLKEGRLHLRFMMSIYRLQLREGRKVLHEHPSAASSWKEPAMAALLKHADVDVVTADQCMYNLYTTGPDGEPMLAKKPTKWASNSAPMLARLQRRCDGKHPHQHLEAGRAKDAAYDPPDHILEIRRGMHDDADHVLAQEEPRTARLVTTLMIARRPMARI